MKRQWLGPGGVAILLLIVALWYTFYALWGGPKSTTIIPPRPAPDSSAWVSQRGDTLASGSFGYGGCWHCKNRNELGQVTKDTVVHAFWHELRSDNKHSLKLGGNSSNTVFDWCEEVVPCPEYLTKGEVK